MSDQGKTQLGHTAESGAHPRSNSPSQAPGVRPAGAADATVMSSGGTGPKQTLTGMTAPSVRPKSVSGSPSDATVVLGAAGPAPIPNGPTAAPGSLAQGTPIPGTALAPNAATNIAQPRAKRPSVAPSVAGTGRSGMWDQFESASTAVHATSAAPHPGVRINQYELIKLIGEGGMGSVYMARDLRLGRRVAITRAPAPALPPSRAPAPPPSPAPPAPGLSIPHQHTSPPHIHHTHRGNVEHYS